MNWFRKNYAYLCLLFLLVLALIFPIQDGDVFFYLSLGRKLFENGSLPDKDPFLYTIQDWTIYHEWLSYVLYYSAYLISGFAAVILFKTFLWLCGFLTILRTGIKSKVPSSSALSKSRRYII